MLGVFFKINVLLLQKIIFIKKLKKKNLEFIKLY